MKKIATIALSGMLASALFLAACGGQGSSSSASSSTGSEATSQAAVASSDTTSSASSEVTSEVAGASSDAQASKVVGGWTVFDGTTSALNDDIRAAWDKAMEGLTGVGYEPIRLLASQVVSGSNYAILARGTTVTAEPSTDWYVVVLYVDLQGNASISSINRIDLSDVKVADTSVPAGDIVGGWKVVDPDNSILEPEEAQKAFNKATEAYVGVSLSPLATLATQVVSGTNYLVLCTGMPTTENPTSQLYLAEIYADLQGGAQVTNVSTFDLLSYIG